MKHRISISIDEKTYYKALEAIKTGRFRNKSHVFEYAINSILAVKA